MKDLLNSLALQLLRIDPTLVGNIRVSFICHGEVFHDTDLPNALNILAENYRPAQVSQTVLVYSQTPAP